MGSNVTKQIQTEISNGWSIVEGIKDIDEPGENYIDYLPDEILARIFQLLYPSGTQNVLNLLLVCKRWKNLMEFQHLFGRSLFFEKRRSNEAYLLALKSRRCYGSFTVDLNQTTNINRDWLHNILQKNQNSFKEVTFNLGLNEKSFFNYYINPPLTDFSDFYLCLISMQNAEVMNMNFRSFLIQEDPADFDRDPLEFGKLKALTITWQGGDRSIAKYFLDFIKTPCIEKLRIELPGEFGTAELGEFWNFINENSAHLKEVYIWSKDVYGFDWNDKFLHIWNNGDMRGGMKQFLPNRLKNLRELKVHWINDRQFLSSIFEEAKKLEHFETSIDPASYCSSNRSYDNIKMFTLWHFHGYNETLTRIQTCFPSIEIFRFAFGYVDENTKNHLHLLFPNLKEIKLYKSALNTYEII
jgi:hypothetical protein